MVEEAEVHLVLIDAVVEGKDGHPLRGLRLEEFALQVDGRDAAIAAFEDHCPAPPPSRAAIPPPQEAAPQDAAPGAAAPSGGGAAPRIVLYFDLPHLSPDGAARSVSAARRYLESATDAAALFLVAAYGREVKILLPFSSDRPRILAALDEVLRIGGPYDEGPFTRLNKVQQVTIETCPKKAEESRPGGFGSACPNQIMVAKRLAQEEEILARRSLQALKALLTALSGIEGRKALVFFSETLKDEPGVQYLQVARTTPKSEGIDTVVDFARAVDEASGASAAFYPVYAAGLDDASGMQLLRSQTSLGGAGTVSSTVTGAVARTPRGEEIAAGLSPSRPGGGSSMLQEVGPIEQVFRTAEAASLGFNASIAAETGGRHLGRTNDLSLVFPLVTEEMSCYYVLGYVDPPPHDGGRHTLRVSVGAKGARVRSRSFYVDSTPKERRERRLRTALAVPGAFREFDVGLHLFPFGRSRAGRKILMVTDVPVRALAASAAPGAPDAGAAAVEIRGRVAAEEKEVCAFGAEFTVPAAGLSQEIARTLHVEAACDLAPGRYEVVTAVMEKRGEAISAARREIEVPAAEGFHVSEPQLWAASRRDMVEASQARSIVGRAPGVVEGAASPRVERRLAHDERGILLFLVCPEQGGAGEAAASGGGSVTVERTLLSGEDLVAKYPPLRLDGAPDPGSGCWAVSSPLPERLLGDGIYFFDYEVGAPRLPEPVRGRAAFEVWTPP